MNRNSRTYRLVTLGCKVNQYESQFVKELLEQNDFREAGDSEIADLCVVNTCTVTAEADRKARQAIRQIARQNPGIQTVVMGCYATRDPQLVSTFPSVVAVVQDKREIPDVFQRFGITTIPKGITHFAGRQRAFVKVQDGCILQCTYCIIPKVRPGLRSRDPETIAEEIQGLVGNGYREIVLSGIHLGHFGVDTTRAKSGLPPFRLEDLIERLDQIPGDWRLRLSSIEAAEVGTRFIEQVAGCARLCPHFHPSLQSGSNTVLSRMRRRYRIGRFLEKLDQFRERFPNAAFTTDVIVGFPGETDVEFQETLDACAQARFMKIHIFPFSAREGTPAATMPDQVSPTVQKERCQRLAVLEKQLHRDYCESLLGTELVVLVERSTSNETGFVSGTACRYVQVELQGDESDIGDLIRVRVQGLTESGVSATRIQRESMQIQRAAPEPISYSPLFTCDSGHDSVPHDLVALSQSELSVLS